MLEVVGHRILIKPKELEKKTESGILLEYGEAEKRHRAATMEGVIAGIGPLAWHDWGDGSNWVSVGDKVLFAQYAGKLVTDPESKEDFFVVNDEDVQVRIT